MALRGIIFRGKRLDKGEWVEGFFAEKKDPLLESDVRNAFIDTKILSTTTRNYWR